MAIFAFEITGTSGLLQNKFNAEAMLESQAKTSKRTAAKEEKTIEQIALEKAHFFSMDDAGNPLEKPEFCFPTMGVQRAIISASSNHKIKGSRKSLKSVVPGAVTPVDQDMPLLHPDTDEPLTAFLIDMRSVVNPNTKGRMPCVRPFFPKWKAEGELSIDTDMVDNMTVKMLMEEAGKNIGIGDFRPQNSGPFGRFTVTKWLEVK